MALWSKSNLHITSWGQSLINRSALGEGRIEITKALSGSRLFSDDGITPENAITLSSGSIKHRCAVYGWYPSTEEGDTAFVLEIQLDNTKNWYNTETGAEDITPISSYELKQFGIYARLVDSSGAELIGEQLFLVSECVEGADEIPMIENGEGGLLLNHAIQLNLFASQVAEDETISLPDRIYVSMTNAGVLTKEQYNNYVNTDLALLKTSSKNNYSGAINEVRTVAVEANNRSIYNQERMIRAYIWQGFGDSTKSLDDYCTYSATLGENDLGYWTFYGDATPSGLPLGRKAGEVIMLFVEGMPNTNSNTTDKVKQTLIYMVQKKTLTRYNVYTSNNDGSNAKLTWSDWTYVDDIPLDKVTLKKTLATVFSGNKVPVVTTAGEVTESDITLESLDLRYRGLWTNGKALSSITHEDVGMWRIRSGFAPSDLTTDNGILARSSNEEILLTVKYTDSASGNNLVAKLEYMSQQATFTAYKGWNGTEYAWSAWQRNVELPDTKRALSVLTSSSIAGTKLIKMNSDRTISETDILLEYLSRYRGKCSSSNAVTAYTSNGYYVIDGGTTTPSGIPLNRTSNERIILVVEGHTSYISGIKQTLIYTTQNKTYVQYLNNSGTWSGWVLGVHIPVDNKVVQATNSTSLTGTKVPVVNGDRMVSESNVEIAEINQQNGNGFYFPDPEVMTFTEEGWTYVKPSSALARCMSAVCCWNGIGGFAPYNSSFEYLRNLMPPHNPVNSAEDTSGYAMLNLGCKDAQGNNYTRNFNPVDVTTLKVGTMGEYVYNDSIDMSVSLSLLSGLNLYNGSYPSNSAVTLGYRTNFNYYLKFRIARTGIASGDIISLFDGKVKIRCTSSSSGVKMGVYVVNSSNNITNLINIPINYDPQDYLLSIYTDIDYGRLAISLRDSSGNSSISEINKSFGTVKNLDCKFNILKNIKFWGLGEATYDANKYLSGEDIFDISTDTYENQVLSHLIPNQGVLAQLTPEWFNRDCEQKKYASSQSLYQWGKNYFKILGGNLIEAWFSFTATSTSGQLHLEDHLPFSRIAYNKIRSLDVRYEKGTSGNFVDCTPNFEISSDDYLIEYSSLTIDSDYNPEVKVSVVFEAHELDLEELGLTPAPVTALGG